MLWTCVLVLLSWGLMDWLLIRILWDHVGRLLAVVEKLQARVDALEKAEPSPLGQIVTVNREGVTACRSRSTP